MSLLGKQRRKFELMSTWTDKRSQHGKSPWKLAPNSEREKERSSIAHVLKLKYQPTTVFILYQTLLARF